MLSFVEINLKNIAQNCLNLKKAIGNVKLLVVLRANAYGHGLIEVAKTVSKSGADYLGVDNINDGLALRKAKIQIPILVFDWSEPELIEKAVQKDLTLTVFEKETARAISRAGIKLRKRAKVHLEVETGLNQYGIMPRELIDFFSSLKRMPKIEIEGIYSHFGSAEIKDKSHTFKQLGVFQQILEMLRREGLKVPIRHIANSATTLSMPSTYFDMVRLGITIYGLFPSPELGTFFDLNPALALKSKVVALKRLLSGERVGGGGPYLTDGQTLLAVIPIGYADGYDRRLSNYAKVLVGGERAPVIGRVGMKTLTADVTRIENVKVGDEVVLIGSQGSEQITAGELAGILGTINYEIVTSLSASLPRVYIR